MYKRQLTRQAVASELVALADLAVLFVPAPVIDALVKARPALARDIGQAIDARQDLGERALERAGEKRLAAALVIA